MWDDRAVSEVVGFILVFAIIIGSVGILYVTGFGAMEDFQQSEQSQNAERAMEALAENFDDIQRNDGVEYRAGELNLRGGSLEAIDDGTNITIKNESETLWDKEEDAEIGSLTYDHEGTTIVYQGGAVIRDDPSGERIARPPPMRCTGEEEPRAVISLLVIDDSDVAITSASSQEVTATREDVRVIRTDETIEVSAEAGPYKDLWNDAFEAEGLDECEGDATSIIRITTISLEVS